MRLITSDAVPAKLMDGKTLAERIRAQVAEDVKELGEVGLSTILVGDDPASDIYIRLKQKAAIDAGILARDYRLAEDTSEEELLELIDQLNRDDSVDGVLVQLPLPAQIDEARAIEAVDPAKDVDSSPRVPARWSWGGAPSSGNPSRCCCSPAMRRSRSAIRVRPTWQRTLARRTSSSSPSAKRTS